MALSCRRAVAANKKQAHATLRKGRCTLVCTKAGARGAEIENTSRREGRGVVRCVSCERVPVTARSSQVSRGLLPKVLERGHRLRRQMLVGVKERARRHQPAKVGVVDQPPRPERRDHPPVLRKRKSARDGDAPVAVAVLDNSHLPKKETTKTGAAATGVLALNEEARYCLISYHRFLASRESKKSRWPIHRKTE